MGRAVIWLVAGGGGRGTGPWTMASSRRVGLACLKAGAQTSLPGAQAIERRLPELAPARASRPAVTEARRSHSRPLWPSRTGILAGERAQSLTIGGKRSHGEDGKGLGCPYLLTR